MIVEEKSERCGSPGLPAVPDHAPEPPADFRPQRRYPRFAVAVLPGTVLASSIAYSMYLARYEPVLLAAAVVSFLALLCAWPALRAYPGRTAFIALNLGLIFVYLWSLDESVHVVVRATPTHYTVTIGNNSVTINSPGRAGRIGIYDGTAGDYQVGVAGESRNPGIGPLAPLGLAMRQWGFAPAWADIRATGEGARTFSPAVHRALNRRGEAVAAPGTVHYVASAPSSRYVVSADLLRPDGMQGLVVGASGTSSGYMLAVRMDAHSPIDPGDSRRPVNGVWYRWNGRPGTIPRGYLSARNVDIIPMLQRDIRIFLNSIMIAWLVVLLTYGAALAAGRVPRLGERGPLTGFLVRRGGSLPAALAVATCFCLTALIARYVIVIPHVPDSVAYLFQAQTMAMGRLSVPAPHLSQFFSEPFVLTKGGQWFGKYPPGWPLVLALGARFGAAWLVNPVLSAATLCLVFLAGRRMYGPSVAAVAVLFVSLSPMFLLLGGSYMAHTATLFWFSGFLYLFVRWLQDTSADARVSDWKLLVPAGLCVGMAFITRQLDVVAAAPPFLILALRQPIRAQVRAYAWFVAGAAAPLAFMLYYNLQLTGSPLRSPYTLWWSFDHLGFGANVGPEVFTLAHGLWNTSFNLQSVEASMFGWPFYLSLALPAIPFLLRRANRWDLVMGAVFLCLVVAYTFYYGSGVAFQPRYYSVALPGLAFLSARGLQELYRLPSRLALPGLRPSGRWVVPLFVGLLLTVYDVTVFLPTQIALYHSYGGVNTRAIDSVSSADIHNAIVFVAQPPPDPWVRFQWWAYPETFSSNSPLLNTDVVYARDRGRLNRELMAMYPGRHYYRLEVGQQRVNLRAYPPGAPPRSS